MSGKPERPLTPAKQKGKPQSHCLQCVRPFDAAVWPRSKWTLSGFSPWCPSCHVQFAPARAYKVLIKRRPKVRQEESSEEQS